MGLIQPALFTKKACQSYQDMYQ